MRLYFALPYLLIEALAFWGVSRWLGTGVALILLFVCLFGGLILAAWEMQNISRKLSRGTASAGRAVGDLGLIGAGAMGVAMPGFVTSIAGLLLIFTPTRALVRNILAKSFGRRSKNSVPKALKLQMRIDNKHTTDRSHNLIPLK